MTTPPVLDLDSLLGPIPGGSPAGANLREDYSPTSVYQAIKTARGKARAAERRLAEGDSSADPDWSPVLELVPGALAAKSKDLELAAWLAEALLRRHGFAGLRDGFKLARLLVERYWDQLHPMPDEEGVGIRVAALGALNGLDGAEGTLIVPINKVPLTGESAGEGPFARWHFRQAADLQALADPEKRERRIREGAVTPQMLERAEAATSAEFCGNLREDLAQCLSEFEALAALLGEKCGQDGPPSSMLKTALKECLAIVESMAMAKPGANGGSSLDRGAGDSPAGDGQDGRGAGLRFSPGGLRSREEAFQALLRVAQFFKDTEPHSPVSYALERAVRWGRMALPDLLAELISEEGARSSVFRLVGIPPRPEGG